MFSSFVFLCLAGLRATFPEHKLMFPTEMAQCIGGGLKANALSMQFTRNIKPNAQLVLEARAKGLDPTEALTYDDKSKMLKGSTCVFCLRVWLHHSTYLSQMMSEY